MGDLLGFTGASLFILSYFILQMNKDFAKSFWYSIMNLSGATLMLLSVYYNWNLGVVINNGFWIILSLYGLLSPKLKLPRNEEITPSEVVEPKPVYAKSKIRY